MMFIVLFTFLYLSLWLRGRKFASQEVGCRFHPIVNVVMKIDSSIAEYSILNLSVLGLSS